MDDMRQAFLSLPDTVVITDVYWYILDFNHAAPFDQIKKGTKLQRYMPDCADAIDDIFLYGDRFFQRKVTRTFEHNEHVGYTVYLADITDKERLVAERRQKSCELAALTKEQARANAELEAYARQAESLCEYEEQLRIARNIHDDAGHAITALHTISQMCLQLKDSDFMQYSRLLDEGIAICERAAKEQGMRKYSSLRELLETFRGENPFPVELSIQGDEPEFAKSLYEVVQKVIKEAYHNTLSHSLADNLTIEARMDEFALTLRVFDNGTFHGAFERGFGLKSMEENVIASGGMLSVRAVEGEGFGITAVWRNA